MCVFEALWASKGVAGFMRTREGVSKAVAVSIGREKVLPAALCHRESAKKFALSAQDTPHSAFLCLLGEFFRANRHCAGLGSSSAPSRPAAGGLRHAKPSGGVSPACRRLGWRHSPRLVAARPRLQVVWPPKCRPIGRKSLKMACFG